MAATTTGCSESSPEQRAERIAKEVERKERVTAQSIDALDKLTKLKALCEANGGVKEFDISRSCGRYCSGAYLECNNGLSVWMK